MDFFHFWRCQVTDKYCFCESEFSIIMFSRIHDILCFFTCRFSPSATKGTEKIPLTSGMSENHLWSYSPAFTTPTLRCKTQNIHIHSTKRKEIRPLGRKYRSAHAKRSYLCHSRSELTCLFQCRGGGTHAPFQFFGVYTLLFAPPLPSPATSDPRSTARPAHPLTGLLQMELFWRPFLGWPLTQH